MKLQESGENYLETIYTLEQKNKVVRCVDIANALGYSKPSINRAMGVLKKAGYIEQEAYGDISLTESGRKKALEIYGRHQLITEFLMKSIGLDPITAERDACRLEHVISELTVEKMREFVNK